MTVVGFVGFIGSGKDTAADFLVSNYGFKRDSFASSLKDAVSSIFKWDRELLEGRTTDGRKWRDQVDTWWANRLNIPHLTPRWVLQNWGTEVFRVGFHDDIWIASLENRMRSSTDNIVISDVRFPNEIKAIHNAGGIVIRVKRGAEPAWYDAALAVNRGPDGNVMWATSISTMQRLKIHASETAWVGGKIDFIVTNDTTVDGLTSQIATIINGQESIVPAAKAVVEYEEVFGS